MAFIVYKVMMSIADAFKKIKNNPIVGAFDRLLGAILGFTEALVIVYLIEYVTNIEIISSVLAALSQLYMLIRKSL